MNHAISSLMGLALVPALLIGAPASVAANNGLHVPDTSRPAVAGSGPEHARDRCIDPVHEMRGEGQACHTENGLLKIVLRDGSSELTHGPDPTPQSSFNTAASTGQTGDLGALTLRNPVCTSANPHGGYGNRAIIAVPSDGVRTITVAAFRSLVQQIDGAFFKSAVESGSPNGADLVFDCDSTGAVQVDVVRLTKSAGASTFDSIVSDLNALGYRSNSTNHNFVVYFTAPNALNANIGGEGTVTNDPTLSPTNKANPGGRYAIEYNQNSAEILMHEIGHTMGAVEAGGFSDVWNTHVGIPEDPSEAVGSCTVTIDPTGTGGITGTVSYTGMNDPSLPVDLTGTFDAE